MSKSDQLTTRRDVVRLAGGAASLAALGAAMPTAVHAAAPMLGVLRPQIYRFKLGSFEITNILDGYIQPASLHPTFGNDRPAADVEALAKANGISAGKFENPYVPTLVNTGKELVLFDAGNAKGRQPTTGNLSELIATAGYKPEQIDVVVITHGHPDHIGGLATDGKPIPTRASSSARWNSTSGRRGSCARRARRTSNCSTRLLFRSERRRPS